MEELIVNPELPFGVNAPEDDSVRLSNSDFRNLLMSARSTVPQDIGKHKHSGSTDRKPELSSSTIIKGDDKGVARRKRKQFYAKLKRQELERQAELEKKYRDRAKERREGFNRDYEETEGLGATGGNYRAVAPSASDGNSAAEQRKKQIQESKYLGGDMEHTHLVKGLDYALLHKVRAEINYKEKEDHELDLLLKQKRRQEFEDDSGKVECKTVLGKNIMRVLFRNQLPDKNELFLPGRMAYVVNLEEEEDVSELPTTLIRSKADCPTLESHTTLTTNDIVINKLTQILSYLRAGERRKKSKKKGSATLPPSLPVNVPGVHDTIFEDSHGDYHPHPNVRGNAKQSRVERPSKSYFTVPSSHEEARDNLKRKDALSAEINGAVKKVKTEERLLRLRQVAAAKQEEATYMECYPVGAGYDDSDDDADYMKMDMGNKKGPMGRWDFETQEEYSSYMGTKEALPKAAFQYGIKMDAGRKTRRNVPKHDEKTKIDREWKEIEKLMAKRKTATGDIY